MPNPMTEAELDELERLLEARLEDQRERGGDMLYRGCPDPLDVRLLSLIAVARNDLAAAIGEFSTALPGWWFSVGDCSVSADASCGPDRNGVDRELLKDRSFDNGFHADLPKPASLAEALRAVTTEALVARAALNQQEVKP